VIRALETYHRKRRLVEALSTVAIIVMPFLNIFRLDIPTLRFYFFNSVLWLDEFYLLFLALMLLLWVIVMFAMLYGRVWCGWMCPQTVVSELVRWWEVKTRRLFRVPRSGGAYWRRGASFALVAGGTGAVSLFIGFNLVAFFVDPVSMIRDIAAGTLGVVTGGVIAGIAALVLIDGLYWREKFCAKACPYGMMQMLVTDGRTQIVQYRTEQDGECIECKACLRVCSMGIDIRESPYQSECIQCGECVDACAQILARMDKPTLIGFSWGTHEKSGGLAARLGFVDAKRWIMLALTLAYTVVLVFLVSIRQPLSLSVSGDRSTLFRKGEDGRIYNDYSLKVSNRSLSDGAFSLQCVGGPAAPDCTLQIG
jgi:cytochrome c oxidase accessory protein FixG